ncbi:MAG: hypothetical protein J0H17_12360 [Rhizobiales bacterium]|nr:hypothetical protein [Hyphomicrobiales bacterium]
MFKADWNWWSKKDASAPAAPAVQTIGPESFVSPDGACAAPTTEGVYGVSLGMSECQLVQLAGPTHQIDIGTNERGERTAVITYPTGDRAGIYRFTSGTLVSIEAAPAPAPPKPTKPAPRRHKPKPPRS